MLGREDTRCNIVHHIACNCVRKGGHDATLHALLRAIVLGRVDTCCNIVHHIACNCVRKDGHTLQHYVQHSSWLSWLQSYVNKEIWLTKSFLLRHTIACNAAWNVAEVELASTPAILRAILHATIAKVGTQCNSAIARNIARNVASLSLSVVFVPWRPKTL